MESCQKVQKDFPTCRCSDWPEARASFSGGDLLAKASSATLVTTRRLLLPSSASRSRATMHEKCLSR